MYKESVTNLGDSCGAASVAGEIEVGASSEGKGTVEAADVAFELPSEEQLAVSRPPAASATPSMARLLRGN